MPIFNVWLLLIAGCLGLVMGINRTIRTREHEGRSLQNLSGIAGILLIGAALYGLFSLSSGSIISRTSYAVPFMMIFGLSLCARQLEGIPVTAVFILIVGLGVLYVIGHGGLPHSLEALVHKQTVRKLIMIGVIVIGSVFVMTVFTMEKLVDLVLNALGLGLVVIVLSAISIVHAGLVLFTKNSHGLLKFM